MVLFRKFDDFSFLIIGGNNPKYFLQKPKQLTVLHKATSSTFGLDHNNYIGILPQYNSTKDSAPKFYIHQRLEPQFKIAKQKGIYFSNLDIFLRILKK